MRVWKRLFYWMLLPLLAGCVTPFEPEVLQEPVNILVVTGYINTHGATTIQLSRTRNLAAPKGPHPPETQAVVAIEDDAGTRWALPESAPGTYTSANQQLPTDHRYRLRIQTTQGRDYASDFVAVKPAPAIDSLAGRVQADGVQLYLSTHDDAARSQYYRWEYEETWEFTSGAKSGLEKQGDTLLPRRNDIYHCWRSENSTAVQTASTVALSRDAVLDYRLLFLPANSIRLRYKYSILVRQFALTEEEFQYWETLKKNTQSIGGLFDPLPSQLTGNIHNTTNSQEPVLGYIGAGTVSEKRIFIDNSTLPTSWISANPEYAGCMLLDTIFIAKTPYKPAIFFTDTTLRVPVGPAADKAGKTIGYTYQTAPCVDCRLRGSNLKPSFWP